MFSKQQIAKTANYIADKLIHSDQPNIKKWFCEQFKHAIAERSQAVSLDFSNMSQDFSQLQDAMQEKGIQVPDGFKVLIFNNGNTIVHGQAGVQFTIFGADEPVKERFDLQDLGLALHLCDEQFDSSEEDWEAEFRAPPPPMLSQFIPFSDRAAASSEEVDEDPTLSPRQKIASI